MKHEKDGWLVRKLKELDEKYLLRPALNHPWKTIFIAAGLVIFSFLLYPIMGKTFLPEFNEGTLTISLYTAPGTSLEQSNKIGTLAEKLILSVPEVVSVGRRTGRAEQDEHAEGLHSSEIDVDLKTSDRTREKILDSIRKKLSQIPGTTYNVGQPISHRLDHLQSGVRAQIALKISGDNLETLRDLANKTEHAIKDIPGVVDLQIEKQTLIPQLRIEVDREQVVAYGVQPGALTEILEVALNGKIVSQVIDGQKTYDLVVQYESNSRSNPEVIRQMLIDTNSGYKVPLSHLAKVFEAKGPNVINRENGRRRIVISCNASGRALDEVVRDIENTFNSTISLPSGYSVSYEGQFQSQKNASSLIGILSAVVLLAIFFILYSFFKSTTVVLQILINIPLSFIGALTLTYLLIGTISVATLVGLIALAGIASRNTIMMISHYLHLMEYEGENFSPQMIIRGSLERLVPVTMTALTAGLGLLPLVFAAGEPGKEILYPVAVVILGGLVSSTILDMAVTPAVFLKFGKPRS